MFNFCCCFRKKVNFSPVITTDPVLPKKTSVGNPPKPQAPPTPPTSTLPDDDINFRYC